MFVVKRPFRDAAGMVSAGSIIEPADIKRFKHRVLEGHIVEVNEHNFERYADFFKKRYGVDLPPIVPAEPTKSDVKPPEAPVEPKAPDVQVTEVKKVVAATVK